MAEVIGIVAGVVQIVGFGLSTASGLHEISQGVSAYSGRIERLADHVKANSRVLDQLAELLRDDAAAGQRLSASFQADVEFAAQGCRRVFREIEKLLQKQRDSKLEKLKYTLFDEPQVEGFRSELSQCQITLNLMLLIHWQKDVAKTRQDVMNLLRGELDTAKCSNVPSIASAIHKLVDQVAAIDMGDTTQSTDSFTTAGEVEKFDSYTGAARDPAGQEATPSVNSGTISSGHLFNSFIARPSQATSRNPPSSSNTLPRPDIDDRPSRNEYCMWSAHVDQDRRISFDEIRLTPDRVDRFVKANADHLLETLAKLDRHIKSAINKHAQKMNHNVVAVVPRHRRSAFRMLVRLSSLDLVTRPAETDWGFSQSAQPESSTLPSLGGHMSMLETLDVDPVEKATNRGRKRAQLAGLKLQTQPDSPKSASDSIASSSAEEHAATADERLEAVESQQKASRDKHQDRLHGIGTSMPRRDGRRILRMTPRRDERRRATLCSMKTNDSFPITNPSSIDSKTYGKGPDHDHEAVDTPESHSDEDRYLKSARPRGSEEEEKQDAGPLNPDDDAELLVAEELIATLTRRWNRVAPEENLHSDVA